MQIELSDNAVARLVEKALTTDQETPSIVTEQNDGGVTIGVLQRGWIVVGRYAKVGQEHVWTDASIIRVWGTTKGLGQLALEGPQSGTTLDPCGTVRAHELATVLLMPCDETKWAL